MNSDYLKSKGWLDDVSPQSITFGQNLFNNNRVKKFWFNNLGDNFEIGAEVHNAGKINVRILFDSNFNLVSYQCGCPSCGNYIEMCGHCVAVLFYFEAALRTKELAKVRSLDAAKSFLGEASTPEICEYPLGNVRVEPSITLGNDCVNLWLYVGVTRMYKIRDVDGFLDDIRYHRYHSYGKQLAFTHDMSVFDELSIKLITFVNSIDWRKQSEFYYNPWSNGIKLNFDAFGQLFDMYVGQSMQDEDGGRIEFVEDEGSFVGVALSGHTDGSVSAKPRGRIIISSLYAYVCTEGQIIRCAGHGQNLYRLMASLLRNKELLFDKDSVGSFASLMLPELKPDSDVKAEKLLRRVMPDEVNMTFKLDLPSRDRIICEAVCRSGEYEYPLLAEARTEIPVKRDFIKEHRIYNNLRQFFDDEGGYLTLSGDDAIYEFLTEKIHRLEEFGEVVVSDRLKRIDVVNPVKFSASVSMSSGVLSLELELDGLEVERLAEVLAAYREKRKYYRLKNGDFVELSEKLGQLDELLEPLGVDSKRLKSERIELDNSRAFFLDDMLKKSNRKGLRADIEFGKYMKRLRSSYAAEYTPPASLDAIMRPYQKVGYGWLRRMEECSFGGILADEMGLGKTLQVIALLLDRVERGKREPSIVVCPASLVFNWKSELARFSPELNVRVISGTAGARAKLIGDISDGEVIVTSYDLLKKDIPHYSDKRFGVCVVDEAQYIKNHSTLAAKSVRELNCIHRFALTGTPVENRLGELWSIFDFLMPGYLYGYTAFRQKYELPIAGGDNAALERLKQLISPFVLRRRKSDVLQELPPKQVSVVPVELYKKQNELYRAVLADGLGELDSDSGVSAGEKKLRILALLTRLRQLCCDPSLCYDNYTGGSAKLDACIELLGQAKESGHRALIFSQFTTLLEHLAARLEDEGIAYETIRGSTRKARRLEIADSFNSGSWDVLLVSLKAGGTGLNLVGADIVIHFDPWWNLAAESQATDRAHRIGQVNPVQVYKLIAAGTIEEQVLALQEKKGELSATLDTASISPDELISILRSR